MTASEQNRHQIAAVIEQYRRGFATMDVEGLKAIWDQDYDNIIYVPQEMAQPVRGWAEVEQSYKSVAEFLERVSTMTVGDLSVDVLVMLPMLFASSTLRARLRGRVTLLMDGTPLSCAARPGRGR
jgi:ketosteroid isomerase-like protein